MSRTGAALCRCSRSGWTGSATLTFEHLFGRYTYRGKPVFGMSSTPQGVPLDPYGRNIYLDTYDSAYGPGWERENSFLTHQPNGNFCYGFWRPRRRLVPTGAGSPRPESGHQYRATVIGPDVTPDVSWAAQALGAFDPEHEERMNELGDQIAGSDERCHRD